MKTVILTAISMLILVGGCGTCDSCGPVTHERLNGVLWMQTSAEYTATAIQTYRTAATKLEPALADSSWTAAAEQGMDFGHLPPAIILDVDETVLDNTAFEARLIRENAQFTPDIWWPWCREAQAPPVPGALPFLKAAKERGIEIFYLTNRSHEVKKATQKNLMKFGFPDSQDPHHLLTKNEQEGWGSDKSSRRKFLADRYRIVMIFGDNFNDFAPKTKTKPKERVRMAETYQDMWGRKWFMLSNPDYGDWEGALLDFDRSKPAEEQLKIKYSALETLEKGE